MKRLSIIRILLIAVVFISCRKKEHIDIDQVLPIGLKPTATNPWLPSTPYNYQVGGNNDLATLGRVLFYDKNLSLDKSVSCGSCHQQGHGFADNRAFSIGVQGLQTPRNTHALTSINNSRFWDGKNEFVITSTSSTTSTITTTTTFTESITSCTDASTYTSNVVSCTTFTMSSTTNTTININQSIRFISPLTIPFLTPSEMNMDRVDLCDRLATIPYYNYLFQKAFGSVKPLISETNIQMALGTFMDNITSSNSKFDQVALGSAQFTQEEQDGMNIFRGKGKCTLCHNENNSFGGNQGQFEDIGLDNGHTDLGRGGVTNSVPDQGKFHVPSLKNVGLTAPYMHDGRFKTLEEVVDFFDSGVKKSQNLSSAMSAHPSSNANGTFTSGGVTPSPLNLTQDEKSNLVAFLRTLTDNTQATDIRFSNPFKH
jgi:cytochrome c peroxidase